MHTAASAELTQRAAESELLQASLVQSNASCHDTAAALRATVQAQLAAARDGAGLRALASPPSGTPRERRAGAP